MPATTDTMTCTLTCEQDDQPAVAYTLVRTLNAASARVCGGIEGARDMGLPPSERVLADAKALCALVLDLLGPEHEVTGRCGWEGDVEVRRIAGQRYAWTCPRCGAEHDTDLSGYEL